jgi:hypothetical protein
MATDHTCPFCCETARVEVLEAWLDERAFVLDTCCEAAHEDAVAWLSEAPRKQVAAFLAGELGTAVRQTVELDGRVQLDYGLTVGPVKLKDAKAFIREHHGHCSNPPCSWRWGHGLYNGGELVAVAMVGRPVARKLDHTTTVEVNRLCARRDRGRLTWNACSMLYGAAAREARSRGFSRAITYTLKEEPADTLKAAGWQHDGETKGGSWNRPSRARVDKAPTGKKVRWCREL